MPFELLIWKAYLMGRAEGLAFAEKLLEEQVGTPGAPLRRAPHEKRISGCEKPPRRAKDPAIAQSSAPDARRELIRNLTTAGIRSVDWAEVARLAALAIPCSGVSISLELKPAAAESPERFEGEFGAGGIPVGTNAASCLSVPLPAGGPVAGSICLFHLREHQWTRAESEFAKSIAARIKRMTGRRLSNER